MSKVSHAPNHHVCMDRGAGGKATVQVRGFELTPSAYRHVSFPSHVVFRVLGQGVPTVSMHDRPRGINSVLVVMHW